LAAEDNYYLNRRRRVMPSSVNLGEKLESVVDALVGRGRFGSRSEVLREGVRLVHEREEWLRMVEEAIDRGLDDANAGRVTDLDTVRAEMRERYGSTA
jgi:antitoxin ParD1/3/4